MEQLKTKPICLICKAEKHPYQMVIIKDENHCPKCALQVTRDNDDE